jgi:hypothetical protein
MKLKKLIISGILMLLTLIALVGTTWAYWDMLTATENEIISIGYGDEITVSENTGTSTLELVPTTIIPDSTETNSIVYTYTVGINQSAFDAGNKVLTTAVQNVLIGGASDYSSYVNFVINPVSHTFLSITAIQVTVTVTLIEPATQEVYDAIAGQPITFDVVFIIASA